MIQYEFTLTFENRSQSVVQAYSMAFKNKYIMFYGPINEFQEAYRAKKVVHIHMKKVEKR